MGVACGAYGRLESHIQGLGGGGEPEGEKKLGELSVNVKIILKKLMFKKWNGGMNWIVLAQDRDRWRSLVNAVMNLWVL
jgi:hypothetical protein